MKKKKEREEKKPRRDAANDAQTRDAQSAIAPPNPADPDTGSGARPTSEPAT
jgi:hypothetical protein